MRDLKEKIPRVRRRAVPGGHRGRVGRRQGAGRPRFPRGAPRGRAVFVPVNCAVLGDELFESELLGAREGRLDRRGAGPQELLELSSGGTVVLDEVAALTPRAQGKLLRVLQDGEIRRLGENRTQRLDLRVVAATTRLLDAEAAAGRFRRDLLYLLSVVGLTAPPLGDRGADVAGLTTTTGRTSPRRPAAARPWRPRRSPRLRRTRSRATSASCRTCSPTSPSPGRATGPPAQTLCRPPSGGRSPPSGGRRSPRPARSSNAPWCATPWDGTAAAPANWASPDRESRS